ncbi:MAG: hypothetical protein ACRDPJ_20710 [Nocardioidaceae bacterium]
MHEFDELRGLAALIREPSLEDIKSTARRRRRRAVMAATAVGAAVALIVGGGALLSGYDDYSAPQEHEPAHEPAPGRMSPEGIVTGEASRLVTASTSLDDPDTRIALWEADCPGCGEPDGAGSTRSALALTTDGFADTTYVAAPRLSMQEHLVVGEPHGPRIESPTEDQFLLVDTEKPVEWLVSTDGTVHRVERVRTQLASTDPRLWFRCHPAETPPTWKDGIPPFDPAQMYPWCALDPDSATAYEWPGRWNGSLALPVSGEEPWGIDSLNQPTFAWWDVDGQRQRRFLAESPGDARGAVWNPPTGGPLFFTRIGFERSMDLLVARTGSAVQVVTRDAPDAPGPAGPPSAQFDVMAGTPEGALLAVSTYPETLIWRAADLANDDFELVHEFATTTDPDPTQGGWVHEPTFDGDRIHVWTPRGVVMSADDGLTWTEVTTWR